MKKKRWLFGFVFFAVALSIGLAAAQSATDLSLYREETVKTTQYPGGHEMSTVTKAWIKGQKMRTDAVRGNDVTIIRADLGMLYTINMVRKVYSEAPLEVFRRAAKLSLAMMGKDPTYRWTNREKKIGKWKCREVIIAEETSAMGEHFKTVWWVSEDVGLDNRLFKRIMQVAMGKELDERTAQFFAKLTAIPGYPVRTESSYSRGGAMVKTVNTLQVMERRDIDDSIFEIPPGLTKVVIPLPGELKK